MSPKKDETVSLLFVSLAASHPPRFPPPSPMFQNVVAKTEEHFTERGRKGIESIFVLPMTAAELRGDQRLYRGAIGY